MMQSKKILITGTGLVSSFLSKKLVEKGCQVSFLSRSASNNKQVYLWDYQNNYIDKEALVNTDYIIHLAGANISDKRWTVDRKKEIVQSRVATCNLLYEAVKKHNLMPKAFISSSATGYYGALNSDHIFTEQDPYEPDFLGNTCNLWETAAKQFESIGVRTVVVRTGVVLARDGGIVKKLTPVVKRGMGAVLGTGKQYMPWIHIEDLCNMYIKAMDDSKMQGVFNAVAPEHVNNKNFLKTLVNSLQKPMLLPNIPAFAVRIIFGEMASILLTGSRVSSNKIERAGFVFKFPELNQALKNLTN